MVDSRIEENERRTNQKMECISQGLAEKVCMKPLKETKSPGDSNGGVTRTNYFEDSMVIHAWVP